LDLAALIDAALAPLGDRMADKQLDVTRTISQPAGVLCLGDEVSLSVALRNLVQNVLDHAEHAHHVDIRAAVDGNDLVITVTDDGAGVAAADRRALFDPFKRGARARERRVQGYGLGLAIVRDVVEAHNGVIWYRAAERQGAAFGFRLRDAVVPAEA